MHLLVRALPRRHASAYGRVVQPYFDFHSARLAPPPPPFVRARHTPPSAPHVAPVTAFDGSASQENASIAVAVLRQRGAVRSGLDRRVLASRAAHSSMRDIDMAPIMAAQLSARTSRRLAAVHRGGQHENGQSRGWRVTATRGARSRRARAHAPCVAVRTAILKRTYYSASIAARVAASCPDYTRFRASRSAARFACGKCRNESMTTMQHP